MGKQVQVVRASKYGPLIEDLLPVLRSILVRSVVNCEQSDKKRCNNLRVLLSVHPGWQHGQDDQHGEATEEEKHAIAHPYYVVITVLVKQSGN